MVNRLRYANFQEDLFSSNEIKSIFCPPLFRKRPVVEDKRSRDNLECRVKGTVFAFLVNLL